MKVDTDLAEASAYREMGVGHGIMSGRRAAERPRHVTDFERAVFIEASPEEVFDFCVNAQNIEAILPDRAEPLPDTPLVAEVGGVYEFRYWARGRVPIRVAVRVDVLDRPREIVDVQLRGFFRYWRHTHQCLAEGDGTKYVDRVEFATRFGRVLDRSLVGRDVDAMFTYRQARMKELIER